MDEVYPMFSEKFILQGQFPLEAVRCMKCGALVMKRVTVDIPPGYYGARTIECDDINLHKEWHRELDRQIANIPHLIG